MNVIKFDHLTPAEMNELAQYNGEVARGIVHTADFEERKKLQRQFAG